MTTRVKSRRKVSVVLDLNKCGRCGLENGCVWPPGAKTDNISSVASNVDCLDAGPVAAAQTQEIWRAFIFKGLIKGTCSYFGADCAIQQNTDANH
jgi:hypothetical protein